MIVFYNDVNIPTFVDCAQMDNIQYDILYASEETPQLVDTYIKLITTDKNGLGNKGVVEIILDDKINPWVVKYTPNKEDMVVINRFYTMRNFIERNKRRGLLVVIHDLCTNAKWLSNLTPACNQQGWIVRCSPKVGQKTFGAHFIVAPFIYNNPSSLLFSKSDREKVVDEFRDWFYMIREKYQIDNVSVVTHSFGTYIITKYIEGIKEEDDLPVNIDTLILTGGIITPSYDWNKKHSQ